MMPPRVRFATTSDGVRIAYIVTGDGQPLVAAPGWVSHLEAEWQTPSGDFHRRLGQGRQLLVYDGRGTGLSDRNVDDLSVQARARDLEAVVDHAGLDRFALFGWSQSAPVAIAYAAEHPDRVSDLVLYASFCSGGRGDESEDAVIKAVIDLIRAEWGVGVRATMGFIHPDAERHEIEQSLVFFRQSSTGAVAAAILEESLLRSDVCDIVPRIQARTLVVHRRGDNAVPLESGRQVASLLPNGRFVVLEGDHHPPFYGDSDAVLGAIDEFLGVTSTAPAWLPASWWRAADASAPVTLLFTDLEGSTTLTDRLGDARAQQVLHEHDDIVRDALLAYGGAEVKHTGDGIMASFLSASGALDGAVRIQQAISQRNEQQQDTPIRVRIGLNCGEPVRERDDLFGTAVQLARRICDQAKPEQILVSNVVRELVAGKGFLFADMGEMALRGFEDPVRLYEVRWSA